MKRRNSRFFILLTAVALTTAVSPVARAQQPGPEAAPPPPAETPAPAVVPPAPEAPGPAAPVLTPADTNAASRTEADSQFIRLPNEPGDTSHQPLRTSEGISPAERPNLISVTLDDVELADVVRMFTRVSGANIIASPSNLIGRVTVNLSDVEWQPALESILETHALGLVEKTPGSRVFSIVPRSAGAKEPQKVETFLLKYSAVSDVEPVVKSMLVEGGTYSKFGSKNAIVVKSTPVNLQEIKTMIDAIDTLRDQVFIEAKFMELDDDARKDLGVDWGVLQSYGVTAGTLQWNKTDTRTWTDSRIDAVNRADNRDNADAITQHGAFGM